MDTDTMDKNNILYLLNHKVLTDFEVPILNKKGYGVYIPKSYSDLSVVNSINHATVNFYDNYIHISPRDIIELNKIRWFSNIVLSQNIINILNNNFKYIFLTMLTQTKMMNQLIKNFNGTIYYRFFGLSGNATYRDRVNRYVSPKVKYIFSYPEIYQYEQKLSKFFNDNNSYVIPLGLSNSLFTKLSGTYNRKSDKIIFVCSRINSKECKYYFDIYQNFKRNLKNFEHVILGKNNEAVLNDKTIHNNLPDNEYYSLMSSGACMYYHGKEPRHLHYHPLEAIIIGIPVIFYKQSLLSGYLNDSPGKCASLNEVQTKIGRIINKDVEFINQILLEQEKAINLLTQQNNVIVFDKLF